jgi:hypothetical protein
VKKRTGQEGSGREGRRREREVGGWYFYKLVTLYFIE